MADTFDRRFESLKMAVELATSNLQRSINEKPEDAHRITTEWIEHLHTWIDKELPDGKR